MIGETEKQPFETWPGLFSCGIVFNWGGSSKPCSPFLLGIHSFSIKLGTVVICKTPRLNPTFISLPVVFGLFFFRATFLGWGKDRLRIVAHIKSWKVLRKSFRAALIAAASLTPLPWTETEIYTAPFDLEFLVSSFSFLLLHHQCSVSLKTYAFVVWNHYSLCWVTVKEKAV